ncbi:WG repeat-containing protein [Mycoplasmatota bacterium]|nr:WG repeat-containing protein [Mycoplasmatota bacterium]
MKIKMFLITLIIICIGLIFFFSSSYNPQIKPSSCKINGKLNSTFDILLPISCPNGQIFDSNSIGYSNFKGEIVLLDENWVNASLFHDNYFAIVTNKDHLDAIINKKGNYILDYEYSDISYLGEDRYFLKKIVNEKHTYFFGRYVDGQIMIKEVEYEYMYDYAEGLAAVILKGNNKIGYVDKNGELVIPFIYDRNPLLTHQFFNGKVVVIKDGLYGVINRENEVVVPFAYDYIQPSTQKEIYLKFSQEAKWGLMNNRYEIMINPAFLSMGNDSENIISVSLNQINYAFLNIDTNQLITDFIYKKASNHNFIDQYNYFQNQHAVVTKDSQHFNLLNQDGLELFTEEYLGIKMINKRYVLLKSDDELFYLYNLQTKESIEFNALDILVYPHFEVLAICNEFYEDGAMVYQLYDLGGNEIIPGLKIYDYMKIHIINDTPYLYFNGELYNKSFSSYFDKEMNLIWKP